MPISEAEFLEVTQLQITAIEATKKRLDTLKAIFEEIKAGGKLDSVEQVNEFRTGLLTLAKAMEAHAQIFRKIARVLSEVDLCQP